jgi:hypothetical protein
MENNTLTMADIWIKIEKTADALDYAILELAAELGDLADVARQQALRGGHAIDANDAKDVRNACDRLVDSANARLNERLRAK